MSYSIVKAGEPLTVSNVTVLVYGQPGVGKSSIGFTGAVGRVLTLDFDKGAHRSAFRQDILDVSSWHDVQELLRDTTTLAGYDVICIDTVGRCLDYIVASFDRSNTKLLTRSGNPTMQGWGELKVIFATFIKQLLALKKDIILIAHEKEQRGDNDETIFRPDVSGGSYAEIFKIADFVGRVFKVGKQTVLDFEPCERYLGKNSAGLKPINVPDFAVEKNFLGDLLASMKSALGKSVAGQLEAIDVIKKYRELVQSSNAVIELNSVLAKAKDEPISVKVQIKKLTDLRAVELNAIWDVTSKLYVENEIIAELQTAGAEQW